MYEEAPGPRAVTHTQAHGDGSRHFKVRKFSVEFGIESKLFDQSECSNSDPPKSIPVLFESCHPLDGHTLVHDRVQHEQLRDTFMS